MIQDPPAGDDSTRVPLTTPPSPDTDAPDEVRATLGEAEAVAAPIDAEEADFVPGGADEPAEADPEAARRQAAVEFRHAADSSIASAWRRPPRLSRIGRLVQLVAEKSAADEIATQAAALAFVTLLSLIPLLASLSYFGAGFFMDNQETMVELLDRLLPYTESTINDTIRQFLQQSQSLRGFGFIAFIVTALAAFSMIESIVNQIWGVPQRRPLRNRLNSFVLVLAWGPIAIGLTYSALFVLGQNPTFGYLTEWLPLRLAPFLVTLFGLSMLYWQVPFTRVDFRAALAGGTVAALSLQALQQLFGLYVEKAQQVSVVYGSFGVAMFFMVSIDIAWILVLLGVEVSYCTQNFTFLVRPRKRSAAVEGSWLGLAAMVLIVDRFRHRQPITSHELLAGQLNLATLDLSLVLEPLVQGGYLRENLGDTEGYILSCDPHLVPVNELLDLYEARQWQILQPLPTRAHERLRTLRGHLASCRAHAVSELRLVDLLAPEHAAGQEPTPASERLARALPEAESEC